MSEKLIIGILFINFVCLIVWLIIDRILKESIGEDGNWRRRKLSRKSEEK